ncbi:GntR family transcriptional regulator [Pararhodobacter aggregans]|nr:GntR family transcriptional regulator [Pararhodobacter aggregans]
MIAAPADPMTLLQPIHRPSLHDQLVEQLRSYFTEGPLKPGEKVNEQALASAYGVSRTPLREALKVLASEGLLTWTPNRGVRMAEISAEGLAEVFEVLMALESLAGRKAAARMTEAGIAAIADLQARMEAEYEAGDISAYFRTNQAIHEAILQGSGNEALIGTHRSLSGRVRRARFMANMSRTRWQHAIEEHREILAALTARDAEGLGQLLAAHLEGKLRSLQETLPSSRA